MYRCRSTGGSGSGVADVPGMTDEAARYFRDLYAHLLRLAELSSLADTRMAAELRASMTRASAPAPLRRCSSARKR